MSGENLIKFYERDIASYSELSLLDAAFSLLIKDGHLTSYLTSHLSPEQNTSFHQKGHRIHGYTLDRLRKTHPVETENDRMDAVERAILFRNLASEFYRYYDKDESYYHSVARAVKKMQKLHPEFGTETFRTLSDYLLFTNR